VLVQRYNDVFLHNTLPAPDYTDWRSVPNFALSRFFKLPQEHI